MGDARYEVGDGKKRCFDCLHIKQLDEFHSDRSRSDGKNCRCKACTKERYDSRASGQPRPVDPTREARLTEMNLVSSSSVVDGLKYCPKCRERKPVEEFTLDKSRHKAGRGVYCKPCAGENTKAFYANNDEAREAKRAYDKEFLARNRPKYVSAQKEWIKANPDKHKAYVRKSNLKKKYDLTVEEFEAMLEKQGGRCANPGCLSDYSVTNQSGIKNFSVDHDHKTGAVRALLCQSCNLAMGNCRDSSRVAAGLASYAARFELGIELGIQ